MELYPDFAETKIIMRDQSQTKKHIFTNFNANVEYIRATRNACVGVSVVQVFL